MGPLPPEALDPVLEYFFFLGQQNRGQNSGFTHSLGQDPVAEALR